MASFPTKVSHLQTDTLDIAYLDIGNAADVVLLLHGWPDDPTTWLKVAKRLTSAGYRVIIPWLRGFGATRFLSAETFRDGSAEALAQDALDLVDGLGIQRFAVAGHDWGARMTYVLAALAPERLSSIAALSLPYVPKGSFAVPPYEQSRAWWYQWFMSADKGADKVREDPVGFAHIQWETWSPAGWFDEEEFAAVAASLKNPDWVSVTLNYYRTRWRPEELKDNRYDALRARVKEVENLSVPTLMIQGLADGTVLPKSTEGKDKYFTNGYRRIELDGVGHFPTREAPESVAEALIAHLRANPL